MGETLSASLTRDASNRERRKKQRKSVVDVSLVTVDLKPRGFGLMLDLTDEGMGVQAMRGVEPDTEVQISFTLPELRTHIEGTGVVTWSDAEGRAGVRFKELTSGCSEDLKRWVDESLGNVPLEPQLTETPAPVESVDALPIFHSSSLLEQFRLVTAKLKSAHFDEDLALQTALESVVRLTAASGGALALGARDEMMCRASSGLAPAVGVRIGSSSALSSECIRTGRVVHCEDAETDLRVDREICRELNLRSLLILPILCKGEVRGLLELFSPQPRAFSPEHQALLQELADFTSGLDIAIPLNAGHETPNAPIDPPSSHAHGVSYTRPDLGTPIAAAKPPAARLTKPAMAEIVPAIAGSPIPTQVKGTRGVPVSGSGAAAASARMAPDAVPVISPSQSIEESKERAGYVQTRRSIIAVVLVGTVLIMLAALGWWYGVRVSRAPDQPQQQSPTVTQQPATIAAPPAAVVPNVITNARDGQPENKRPTPRSSRDSSQDTIADDSVRPAQTELQPSAPLKKAEQKESPIEAPSIRIADATAGRVSLPAFTATPALRAASTITGGQLLQRVEPVYPQFARQQRYQGEVVLAFRITKYGTVENVRRVSGNPMLGLAAIQAVKRWRYEPYKLNGEPQEIDTTVTMKFKLPN